MALQLAGAKLSGDLERGIEKDTVHAIALYEKLVQEHDNPQAHAALGLAYTNGVGNKKDIPKAIEHL